MTTVLPPSGDYSLILNSYAPSNADKSDLWKQFLISNNLPTNSPPPQNAPLESAFVNYLKSLYDVTPPTGMYDTLLSSFTGSYTEKMALWAQFLKNNGFPLNSAPPVTGELLSSLTQFLQGITTFSTAALSPDEVAKRKVMLDTFEIILKMLNALQNTIGVQANSLYFYGKWQQEYTKMLTKVPVYVANPTNTWQPNTTDLSKFTLGYAGISVDDLAGYMADSVAKGTVQPFTLQSSAQTVTIPVTSGIGSIATFKVAISYELRPSYTINPDQAIIIVTPKVTISDSATGSPPNETKTLDQVSFTQNFPAGQLTTPNSRPAASLSKPYFLDLIKTALTATYSGSFGNGIQSDGNIKEYNLSASYYDTTKTLNLTVYFHKVNTVINQGSAAITSGLTIPWRYTEPYPNSTDSNQIQQNSNMAGKRGEINSQLQQYIENIRSKRQVIQDTAKQMETNLSGSKEAISQQSDLLTSIIESMKGLISAIFR